jgi:aspartyl-tRNA(Asn)/glutamyl-tRNA(Gln) amidotransferase subunit B
MSGREYLPTIGIECHVQLKTKTKLFAAVGNDARQAEPNTLVSHICLGMPGALPALNEKAVELSCRTAFAFGVLPQKFSKFDRKHYFYPDLPKGYQITQYSDPIVLGGHVDIEVNSEKKRIGITRAHLEEDAGKNTHQNGKDYSLVDLNRAGTPLLEIVSEPDMHSAAEAKAFARELYLLMKYADVSDVDMYHGNMRFDVNVSLSDDPKKMGTRTETKNLNSFRSVEKAIEYEIKRQTEVLQKNGKVIQETRGWDEAKQKTLQQRTKEEAHDYRYFPDPDIPPLVLSDVQLEKIKTEMPVMPDKWRERLYGLGLSRDQVETLLDGEAELSPKVSFLNLIENALSDKQLAKFLANWNINVFIPIAREGEITLQKDQHLKAELAVYELIKDDKLSSTNAKALFEKLLGQETLPENIEEYAQKAGYIQVSDEGELASIVEKVIADNPKAAEDIKGGEGRAIGFMVGQVMKESKGQANPKLAQELIKKQLGL